MFSPDEIIFASTTKCNLKCQHCYVKCGNETLDPENAVNFLSSAKDSEECTIEKVGFSGGEPFLYPDFLEKVISKAVDLGFMFDRLMTNGIWWKSEKELAGTLKKIYSAGFDGKIGLSWDSFHGQPYKKIKKFSLEVLKIFGEESLEIQSVVPYARRNSRAARKADNLILKNIKMLSKDIGCKIKRYTNPFSKTGIILLKGKAFVKIHRTSQIFPCTDERAWKSRKWFSEDFCEGPGNILYVHSNGKIAPCCGFSNENDALCIGNITESYAEVILNATTNPMVKLCFEKGLSTLAEKLEKENKIRRKTNEICTFCDYVCRKKSIEKVDDF